MAKPFIASEHLRQIDPKVFHLLPTDVIHILAVLDYRGYGIRVYAAKTAPFRIQVTMEGRHTGMDAHTLRKRFKKGKYPILPWSDAQ